MAHGRLAASSQGLRELGARTGAGVDRCCGPELIQRSGEAMGVLRLELDLAVGVQAKLLKCSDDRCAGTRLFTGCIDVFNSQLPQTVMSACIQP